MSDHAQSTCPPPESDRMLRHTWLRGFDTPAPLTLFEQLGATLADYAREAGLWGLDMAAEPLAAIAEDLDSLAVCLTEVRDTPDRLAALPGGAGALSPGRHLGRDGPLGRRGDPGSWTLEGWGDGPRPIPPRSAGSA